MIKGLAAQSRLLTRLMAYVIRLRPDALFTVTLGLFSSCLEIASLAVLVPLTTLASNRPINPQSPWHHILDPLGIQVSARFFIFAFFALLLARTLTQLATSVLTNHLNRQLNGLFSARALEAFIHHLNFEQVQKESIGHFVAVAGDEAVRSAQIVTSVIRLIPLLFLFALYTAMITYQSWQTGVGFVLFLLFVLACLWGAFRKSHELGRLQQRQSREAGTHFIESLNGLRTVRAFNAETYVVSRYADMMRAYMRSWFYIDSINSFGGLLPTLLLTGGMLIALNFISPPQLMSMLPAIVVGIMMVLRLLPLATQTLDSALRLTADLKAAENVSEMLEAVKSLDNEKETALTSFKEQIAEIEFRAISFRYAPELAPVLKNFSTTFRAGKSYAISGPSGAGKSTIVDLLLKFYQPRDGVVLINGQDASTFAASTIRQRVVLVEQTTRLFNDTIARNVQFGYLSSEDAIVDTLKMVGLGDLLDALPAREKTVLSYQGGNVSGGQRQRIGLARGLLRDADVLVLDESTSALDQATREQILNELLPRYRDKIVIFIAHDPAILERVDEVIYLRPENELRDTILASIV